MTTPTSWPVLFTTLIGGGDLTARDTAWAMNEIMSGEATDVQIAGFAVALRAKGETVEEVSGLARMMLEHATRIEVAGHTVDIVGTGGDRAHTVNISTMGAIVAAAAGVKVVKHGNRAATSACGSADLLERLGVVIDLQPPAVARIADEIGITFCFAPVFHPALRHAARSRRELAVPTVFNFLGPLTNPARPSAHAIGVSDARMCPILAGVLAARGTSALVFRGDDGLDELTTTTTSRVWVVQGGTATETVVDPAALGVPRADGSALVGGDPEHNAGVAREMLAGRPGPVRDAVLLNAAAALAAAAGVGGAVEEALAAGYRDAARAVDSGAAAALLTRWVELSQRAAKEPI